MRILFDVVRNFSPVTDVNAKLKKEHLVLKSSYKHRGPKTMFEKCQKHEVDTATRDLQAIDKHSFIEKDNIKFTDHKSYLEHHLNNPSLRPYLIRAMDKRFEVYWV